MILCSFCGFIWITSPSIHGHYVFHILYIVREVFVETKSEDTQQRNLLSSKRRKVKLHRSMSDLLAILIVARRHDLGMPR